MSSFLNNLVTYLTKFFLTSWGKQAYTSIILNKINVYKIDISVDISSLEKELQMILVAILVFKSNIENNAQFIFSTQFDVGELEMIIGQ